MTIDRTSFREWKPYAACLLGLWALLLGVYALAGSFNAEFSGADEAAYTVSSVMVREYFGGALWHGESPIRFAQQYYAQYPKVAIGHWPPTYFLVEAAWLMITGVSRPAILALAALTSAAMAMFTVYFCRREGLRWTMAATAGLVVALMPLSLEPLLEIGSDVFTGVAMLVATVCCQRWLEKQTTSSGILLGVAIGLAILCKGTAFALLMMPPLALLVATRRLSVSWAPSTWMPVALALVISIPWYYYAHELLKNGVVPGPVQPLSAEIAPGGGKGFAHSAWYAVRMNTASVIQLGGLSLSILALLSVRTGWHRRSTALLMLPVVTWLFLSLASPHTGLRHLVHLLPVFVVAAAVAANALAPRLQEAVLLAPLVIAHRGFALPAKAEHGFVPAVAWILQEQRVPADRILVASNDTGEGALISEFALHEPAPARTILRASKVLASSTWMGARLQLLAKSGDEVASILDENQVSLVVVHDHHDVAPSPYEAHLDHALGDWQLVRRFSEVSVYQRRSAQLPNTRAAGAMLDSSGMR